FVCTSELDDGARLNESLIKRLTGGNKITARFLHAEHFEFEPEFKIWMETNYRPVVRGTDKGIWARLKLIPFAVNIPEALPAAQHKRREQVLAELQRELPQILAWAVRGCQQWLTNGLQEPIEIKQA